MDTGRSRRQGLIGLVVVLLVFVAYMQSVLDPQRQKYQPGKVTRVEIGTEFIAATLIGLKEVVAGLLWVRADEFFHTGNYEAIIPMVRIITWLDPHQLDVYDTGAWHLAYNFTDSQERSDRRYIPAARALLEEGIHNNPNIFDLYFSLGWTNFQKIQDYPDAVKWFRLANTKGSIDPATGKIRPPKAQFKDRPQFVGHSLAHAYERAGDIDQAIAQWKQNIRDNQAYARQYPKDQGNKAMIDVANNNLHALEFEKKVRAEIRPVKNVHFDAHFQRLGPRKFRVFGTLDLPTGARVRVRLADKDFREQQFKTFTYDINDKQTILIDDLYVRDGKFDRVIDIQRDAAIYPLRSKDYTLTLSFNPLSAPDFVQGMPAEQKIDGGRRGEKLQYGAVGWHGEGLADQKYLVVKNGVRMLEKQIPLARADLA